MLSYSFWNQIIYLLTFDIVILILSALRIGSLWFDRNAKQFQVIVGTIIDPVLLLFIFILCLICYILCMRGEEKHHKPSFIPYFIVTPMKIVLVMVLSGFSFNYDESCLEWLTTWECLCYPFVGIGWSTLNIYLYIIVIKRYNEIDRTINKHIVQNPFQSHSLYQLISPSNHHIKKLHSDYSIVNEQKTSFIAV